MMSEGIDIIAALKGTAGALRSDISQVLKLALYRLHIVPPPLRISIDITNRCNFRCPTCSKWLDKDPGPELDLTAWKQILVKISRTALLREIAVSGGEPFIREDMVDILEEAAAYKLRAVVVSNGDLITDDMFSRLKKIPGCTLTLSLNSLQEEAHDASRGVKGSYAAIMRLIERWQGGPGQLKLSLSTIIMEPNIAELTSLAHFAHAKNLNGIIYQVLLPTGVHYSFSQREAMQDSNNRWHEKNPFWIKNIEELNRQIRQILSLQRRGYGIINPPLQLKRFRQYFADPGAVKFIPCIGMTQRLYIDPAGDIRLCYGFPPIGNILADNPGRVWRSRKAQEIRSAARSCDKPCRLLNCNL